ncbi:MAG TPA: MiaB/RimO family radical SAM methylthiotransferase [Acidimicrobiales bacterium]|nr:MiaB/RimO family radical SAM methylthiotransferase [Acidimicrobiales bacterium]
MGARTYTIRTFGCQMNEHDSERIAGVLEADGLVPAGDPDSADVVVLNTCCIRENADNKLYGHLGHLQAAKQERPGMQIAVAGCLAQKDRELIRQRAPHVDVVFGTHNVGRVAALLRHAQAGAPVTEILDDVALEEGVMFPSALPVRRELGHSAWVTIQIGCDNSCAFCIVPAVRGGERSKPFGEVVDEVRSLAASGVTEVCLLGQNVNSYGRDVTTALRRQPRTRDEEEWLAGPEWPSGRRPAPLFAALLRAVGEVDGIRRVRFTSPHPKDLRPETIEAMATTPAVCEHLHLPLQAGSDRVLAKMHRGYTAARYLERLRAARAAVPGLAVTTDLIVGFPGETESDFEDTLAVVAEAEYDSAYTFIYSPRPGTEAAARTDEFVDPEEVADRFARLKTVVDRSALAKHRARIGHVEEAVVEGPSKRDPAVLAGRTRHNKLVHFTADGARAGTYVRVKVVSAGAHHLGGDLVAVDAVPTHRMRIPVQAVR